MLIRRVTGVLASIIVATAATISTAQADYQRHTDPTIAIIAGAAIVTVGYLAYKQSHYKAEPRYDSHDYRHDKHYQKRHGYNDYSHKRKHVQRHYYNGDRKSTRLNSSHTDISRMPSSA